MNQLAENLLKSMEQMSKMTQPKGADIVECEIIEITDDKLGIYKAIYENSVYLTIYSTNTTIKYKIGQKVFIAVPQGDLSQKKIILGTTSTETSTNPFSISVDSEEEALIIVT